MIDGIDTQAGPNRAARDVAHHPGDGSVIYLPREYHSIRNGATLQDALDWYNSQFGEDNQ